MASCSSNPAAILRSACSLLFNWILNLNLKGIFEICVNFCCEAGCEGPFRLSCVHGLAASASLSTLARGMTAAGYLSSSNNCSCIAG